MFGVVLWSSRKANSAVIWCEDHGDLAYLDLSEYFLDHAGDMVPGVKTPQAGDLIRFETQWVAAVRRARHAVMVSPEHCPNLSEALCAARAKVTGDAARRNGQEITVSGGPSTGRRGEVIAFSQASAPRHAQLQRAPRIAHALQG